MSCHCFSWKLQNAELLKNLDLNMLFCFNLDSETEKLVIILISPHVLNLHMLLSHLWEDKLLYSIRG